MGGQVGDKGVIVTADGEFKVNETLHVAGSKIAHIGVMTKGMIKSGDTVTLKVDAELRSMTCKNHSATHLLQKALRDILGTHVEQAGSYQDSMRTRFDFSHFQAMTPEELKAVEDAVNKKISEDISVKTEVMSIEDAKKTGAMALFGEKYGDEVRVVSMSDYSVELCGGTHVASTGQIGSFKIVSEAGVAAGVRRIEAITGNNVLKYYQDIEDKLNKVASILKSNPSNVIEKAEHIVKDNKALNSELESLKSKMASSALDNVMDSVVDVNGVKLLATSVSGVDMNALREHLQEFGLEKAYRACGIILVDYLCLPEESLGYKLTDSDRKYGKKILEVVFYRGNMGHYNKRGGFKGWKHKIESVFIKFSHFIKFMPLAPSFSCGWLWYEIKRSV
jgi:alanyl-tRNA synthetase